MRLKSSLAMAPFYGDELMVGEAIKNLVHNALVHGRGTDEAEVLITLETDDDNYVLIVRDRGPGIAPEHREGLFQRFFRADSSASGVGLGMAIIARVVEAHRGSIALDDGEGGGLEIHLRLPQKTN